MKIEINHMLCSFVCSRLLSLHKLGVIRICLLLKSEYLFFGMALVVVGYKNLYLYDGSSMSVISNMVVAL
jgi:hypothetical protein